MSLEIDGSHTQSHQVQIARDEKFTDMMSDRVIVGNKFDLGQLSANTYYIRARASASGGQISGTWSEVRLLEVYTLSGGWWLSMPLSPVPPSVPAQR